MSVWRTIIFFRHRTFCWHLCCVDFCLLEWVGGLWVFFFFFLIVLSKLCVNGKSWRGRQSWDESIDTDLHNSTGPASSSHAGPIHHLLSVHIMTGSFFFNSQCREVRGWWWSSTRGLNQIWLKCQRAN
jgi:hypothetical protein